MRKFLIAIFFLFSFIFSSNAFSISKIDSLKTALKTETVDSTRTDILMSICRLFVYNNLDSLFSYGTKAIELADSNNFAIRKALILQYYAKSLGFNGENNRALQYLDSAIAIFREERSKSRIASCLNDVGIIHWYEEQYDSAIHYLKKSLSINIDIRNKYQLALNLINIGNIYAQKGDYVDAVSYYKVAQKIFDDLGDQEQLITCMVNIGNVHILINNYNEAEAYFNKVLEIAEKLGQKEDIALSYANLGMVQQEREKNYDSALSFYKEAYQIAEEIGDAYGKTSYISNLAEVYELKKDYQKAIELYVKAIEMSEIINDYYIICNSYSKLGKIYYDANEFAKSQKYFSKALQLAKQIESKQDILFSSYHLSKTNFQSANYKEAYELLDIAYTYKDSLLNEKQIKELTRQEMQYEFNKIQHLQKSEKQQQDALYKLRIKNQRKIANILLAGIVILLISLFIAIRNFWLKQKANAYLMQKTEIILQQKAEIEAQTDNLEEANHEIIKQKEKLEFAHKHIKDSILYASNLQSSIIGDENLLKEVLADYFVFWKPLDMVSGDFYWAKKVNNSLIIAVADCTGHGVPGALLSIMGISLLNEIIDRSRITTASAALDDLRRLFKSSLKQREGERLSKDGMEMCLCIIDLENYSLQYAGAYHPLLIMNREPESNFLKTTTIPGDRQPVSYHPSESAFTNNIVSIAPGDILFMFSDGFVDQFGGLKNKKFGRKNLYTILGSNIDKPMSEQKMILEEVYQEWTQTKYPQIDDILILGMKIA